MSDSVQVQCKRCRGNFRIRARRLQPGYSTQCPGCEVVIFFEESSSDKHVQAALLAARRQRRVLRESEGVKPAAKPAPTYDRTSS
jgi:hypothetical protein